MAAASNSSKKSYDFEVLQFQQITLHLPVILPVTRSLTEQTRSSKFSISPDTTSKPIS